jgi:hypothetical protein
MESDTSQALPTKMKSKMKIHARLDGSNPASDISKISNECFNLRLDRKLPDSRTDNKSGSSFNTKSTTFKNGQ